MNRSSWTEPGQVTRIIAERWSDGPDAQGEYTSFGDIELLVHAKAECFTLAGIEPGKCVAIAWRDIFAALGGSAGGNAQVLDVTTFAEVDNPSAT